jgi:hypothetical protein
MSMKLIAAALTAAVAAATAGLRRLPSTTTIARG